MENFVYHSPTKIIFGKRQTSKIGEEIAGHGIHKIMLLAGGGSIRENGVYDQTVKSLRRSEIEWTEVWGVRPNPSLAHTRDAIRFAKENRAEAILGVGGGSVIDESKAIAAGVFMEDIWLAFAGRAEIERALPVFSVLTLSGTSSEANGNAVVTNDESREKWAIRSSLLYPRASVIDPSAQSSLPWDQTVNGGIDAMSHIMELYFMGAGETPTIAIDETLMLQIIKSIDELQSDQSDYSARSNLAWSASLALNGLTASGLGGGDWAVHGMEHSLSAFHPDIAHGAGLGVLFPAWIEYNQNENPGHFRRWADKIWGRSSVAEAVEAMKEKFKSWGAPVTLRELGIKENEIEALADNAIRLGPLGRLRKLGKDDVISIMNNAY
ncbi:MAG: iron-containing alcohol dehydrogenase [Bacteroidota bacterium]